MKEAVIQILTGFLGSLGFGILFNIKGKRLAAAALGGLISWPLFLLLSELIPSEPVNYLLVAMMMSVYSEIFARVLKTPTTPIITTALIPLIPGSSLYYTVASIFDKSLGSFTERALHTLALAGALALGIIIVLALSHLIGRIKPRTSGADVRNK